MWGNLAGRVAQAGGNLDLRSTMASIADVVAPPVESDDEEYEEYTDDEEEEYYEEEEYSYSNNNMNAKLKSPLQQALDEEEDNHRRQTQANHEHETLYHQRPVLPTLESNGDEQEEISFKPAPPVQQQQPVSSSYEPAVTEKPKRSTLVVPSKGLEPSPLMVPTQRKTVLTAAASKTSAVANNTAPLGFRLPADASPRAAQTKGSTRAPVSPQFPLPPKEKDPAPSVKETLDGPNIGGSKSSSVKNTVNGPSMSDARDSKGEPAQPPQPYSLPEAQDFVKVTTTAVPVLQVNHPMSPSVPDHGDGSTLESPTQLPPGQSRVAATVSPPAATSPKLPAKTQPAATSSPAPAPTKPFTVPSVPTVPGHLSPSLPPRTPLSEEDSSTQEDDRTSHARGNGGADANLSEEIKPPTKEAAEMVTSQKVGPNQQVSDEPPSKNVLEERAKMVADQQAGPSREVTLQQQQETQDKWEQRCRELEQQLRRTEEHVVKLQQDAAQRMDEEEAWRKQHLAALERETSCAVEAATAAVVENHERAMEELRTSTQQEYQVLERNYQEERNMSRAQAEQFQRLLEEAEARTDAAQVEKHNALAQQEAAASQALKTQERAVKVAEDKLAQTRALLDDRSDEVKALKKAMKELKATVHEHREGADEAEEEIDELQMENETLRHNVQVLEAERAEMRKQLDHLQSQQEQMGGLQMEITMLKEECDRERTKNATVAVNAESSQAELESERDAALALTRDLENQMNAVLADLEVARSDTSRVMTANVNLQNALEAIQNEREAELSLLEQQRVDAEAATAAAHAAAIEAASEASEVRIKEAQTAADAAVKNTMGHVETLEVKLEEYRRENMQLRGALDEAISRLQTTQEDVIDRMLMKNILLDWFSKTGKGKRDVLEVMASLLHFSEDEKDGIHIGEGHSTLGKVVDAVAAPLPPSKADMEHLEGDTVGEKWVNFLLAETGEDESTI